MELVQEVQQKTKPKSKLMKLLILVPGVNLMMTGIIEGIAKKRVVADSRFQESIFPMTEEEKEKYGKLNTMEEKMNFVAHTTATKEEVSEYYNNQSSSFESNTEKTVSSCSDHSEKRPYQTQDVSSENYDSIKTPENSAGPILKKNLK